MSDLGGAIDLVLQRISKHGAASFNEENTAVVLIEPVLAALGWDLSDLGSVDRQYRVYDGTKLDYALKLDGKSILFVEVNGLEQSLDDPKFIAQTVNYANNEGVLWCVLTNALVYRIYKTNEPVAMADKLMVEIDIRNTTDDPSRVATLANLELLSQSSLANGKLTSTAELVFTGGVVREAIELLLAHPTAKFRAVIEQAAGHAIDKDQLDRILGHFTVLQRAVHAQSKSAKPSAQPPPAVTEKGVPAAGKRSYERAHHIEGKPKAIVELFDQLDERALGLGDVQVIYTKYYVNYSTNKKSFMTAELFRDKLKLYFSIPWGAAPRIRPEAMRDVTRVGHYGMGDTEFVLSGQAQLEDVQHLATVAFQRKQG
jgi:predicted transport protein